ncbi:MAG: flagellin [Fibrobacterales bacterium]
MRINHNINSLITQNALGAANNGLGKSLEKLSTGLRINRAADDAAGLSVSEQLRTQVRGLGRAKSNAQDGVALLQVAEGAANEISSILQRMRELSVQSANDTLTSTDRSYLQQEYVALADEIDRIANATQYNTQTLIGNGANAFGTSGSSSSILHIGANDNVGVDNITMSIDALTTGSLGISTGSGAGAGTTIGVSTQASAMSSITAIDTAITSVNTMRSDMGAYVNRLEHAMNNISNQEFNTQDAESRIRDVDFATESTHFTKNQILTQSSTSMLAQANAVPQGALALIG